MYPVVLSNSTLFLRFDASKRQNSPSLWVKSLPWIDVNCGRQLDSMGEVITIQMMRKTPERHKRKRKFDGKYLKKGFKFKRRTWDGSFYRWKMKHTVCCIQKILISYIKILIILIRYNWLSSSFLGNTVLLEQRLQLFKLKIKRFGFQVMVLKINRRQQFFHNKG